MDYEGQQDERDIMGYKLVLTCSACPEQYDVFNADGDEVGYLRLRHGYFRAEAHGQTVYSNSTKGDGIFDPEERLEHLTKAVEAIHSYLTFKLFLR